MNYLQFCSFVILPAPVSPVSYFFFCFSSLARCALLWWYIQYRSFIRFPLSELKHVRQFKWQNNASGATVHTPIWSLIFFFSFFQIEYLPYYVDYRAGCSVHLGLAVASKDEEVRARAIEFRKWKRRRQHFTSHHLLPSDLIPNSFWISNGLFDLFESIFWEQNACKLFVFQSD